MDIGTQYLRTASRDNFFNYLIRNGINEKSQPDLNMIYTRYKMDEQYYHRMEMEEMEQRITENVMKNISIRLEDEALKQLRDKINSIAN